MRARVREWRAAGASQRQLRWISEGIRVEWSGRQRPHRYDVGPSCTQVTAEQSAWLESELARCVHETGALEPGRSREHVCRAFLVPKPAAADGTKKWRLIVDLRPLNAYCRSFGMRMETLTRLRTLARPGDWMFSFDLQDGYNMVGIHPEDRKYFTFDIGGRLFQCAALPFGFSQSPHFFTQLVSVWVRWMRAADGDRIMRDVEAAAARGGARRRDRRALHASASASFGTARVFRPGERVGARGLRFLWYVDDVLFLVDGPRAGREQRAYVERALALLGLQRNPAKGAWEPVQLVTHLGLEVDSRSGRFRLPASREAKLRKRARQLGCIADREQRRVAKRQLASFVGLAQSAMLAVPPARFYLRELHTVMAAQRSWEGNVRLSRQALRDLKWWCDIPEKWTSRSIFRAPETAYLHCDASGLVGWGGVLNGLRPARGEWRPHQRRWHITLKELKAVRFTVETFIAELRGRRVLLWEDNQAVVAVLTGLTSRSAPMMAELRKLWWLLDTNDISLRAKYIRSAANVWADRLSRQRDYTDWMVRPDVFRDIERAWGACTVDRFASSNSAQLVRYNSAFHDPGSEARDCFSLSDAVWRAERNWCHPPHALLDELAQRLQRSGAAAHVLTPTVPGAPWYREFVSLCAEYRVLRAQDVLMRPHAPAVPDPRETRRRNVTVFRIAARRPGCGP